MEGKEGLTDVDTVVVPVCARHVLVDIGVDSCHDCDYSAARLRCAQRVRGVMGVC